jgi:DNA-binding winged helix-turn-helix (wHTH) protein
MSSSASSGPGAGGPARAPAAAARIVEWPAQRDALLHLKQAGVPRLVVVPDGGEPPVTGDCCQDWMWRSGGEQEMRARLQQLSLRILQHGHGRPELDALGMLRVGLRSAHLPAKERALVTVLLASFGRPVLRDELVGAAWPEGIARPNVLASRISSLRTRLSWLGLEIAGSSSTGYCLRASATARDDDADGFEDELASAWCHVETSDDRRGDPEASTSTV